MCFFDLAVTYMKVCVCKILAILDLPARETLPEREWQNVDLTSAPSSSNSVSLFCVLLPDPPSFPTVNTAPCPAQLRHSTQRLPHRQIPAYPRSEARAHPLRRPCIVRKDEAAQGS